MYMKFDEVIRARVGIGREKFTFRRAYELLKEGKTVTYCNKDFIKEDVETLMLAVADDFKKYGDMFHFYDEEIWSAFDTDVVIVSDSDSYLNSELEILINSNAMVILSKQLGLDYPEDRVAHTKYY